MAPACSHKRRIDRIRKLGVPAEGEKVVTTDLFQCFTMVCPFVDLPSCRFSSLGLLVLKEKERE